MSSGRLFRSGREADDLGLNRPISLYDLDSRAVLESRKERVDRAFTDSGVKAVARMKENWVDVTLSIRKEIRGLVVEDGVTRKRCRSPFPKECSEADCESKRSCKSETYDKGFG